MGKSRIFAIRLLLAFIYYFYFFYFFQINACMASGDSEQLLQAGIKFVPPSDWQVVKMKDVATAVAFNAPDKKAAVVVSLPKKVNIVSFKLSLQLFRWF